MTLKRIVSATLLVALCLLAPSSAGEKKVLSVGYDNNPGHPVDKAANYWKKLVDERGGGTLALELYPSTQLGKAIDVFDQALAGDATAVFTNNGYYANLGVKGWDVTAAPFLFNSWDEYIKVTESKWWADNEKKLEELGIKIISHNWEYGVRHLLSKRPVRKIGDLAGLKIRVPNDNSVVAWTSLGCAPTPMSLSEAYMAMQQGTIDAIENPLTTLFDGSFQEVAKNLTLTAHKFDMNHFVCGTKWFNTLTKEQQNILLSTGKEAAAYYNKLAAELDGATLDKLKAAGVTVITLPEADRAEFQKKSGDYLDQPGSIWPKALRQQVLDILKK